MSNMVDQMIIPRFHVQHHRFTQRNDWRLRDLSFSLHGNIVMSGGNEKTGQTFIDVYSDKADCIDKPKMLYSKEFPKFSSGAMLTYVRRVSFAENDSDRIVTCIGDILEIIQISKDAVLRRRKVNGNTMCLSVRHLDIFVGFYKSNKIHVFNVEDLKEIKSILLQGIQSGSFPFEITAVTDKIFVCVGLCGQENKHRPLVFEEQNGSILSEFRYPTSYLWYAWGLTVSIALDVVAIVWSDSFCVGKGKWHVVFYSLKSANESFLIAAVESGVSRIGISDWADKMVTRNYVTGEVKMYDMAEVYSYVDLTKKLKLLLTRDDCARLIQYFNFSKDHQDTIMTNDRPAEALLLVLEERGDVQAWNVDRLTEAFRELPVKPLCNHITSIYQQSRSSSFYKQRIQKLKENLEVVRKKSKQEIQQLTDALATANSKAEDEKREIKSLMGKGEQCRFQLQEELKASMNAHKETEETLQETKQKLEETKQRLQHVTQERNTIKTELEHEQCQRRRFRESGMLKEPTEFAEDNPSHSINELNLEDPQQLSPFHSPGIPDLGERLKIPGQRKQNERGYDIPSHTMMPYPHQGLRQTDIELHQQTARYHEQLMLFQRGPCTPEYNATIQYDGQHISISPYVPQFIGYKNMHTMIGDGGSSQGFSLRFETVNAIARKLDPSHTLGNDWRQLADKLGFTMEDITIFEKSRQGPTFDIIDCAVKSGKLTSLHQLKSILEDMKRSDAAAVVPNEDPN